MQFKKLIPLLTLALLFLLIGSWYTFNYYWETKIDPSFFDVGVSFFCFGLSFLILANLMTYQLFMPKIIPYTYRMISSGHLFHAIRPTLGKEKANRICLLYTILLAVLLILYWMSFTYILNAYQKYQLINYGEIQQVEISEVGTNQKGLPIAIIKYTFNGKIYQKELFLENHSKGQSALVRFSAKSPLMADWNDHFSKN